jgi:hypothetical protein
MTLGTCGNVAEGFGGKGSGGGTGGGVGLGGDGFSGMELSAKNRFTAAVRRKPDKREQRRLRNPSPFDMKKRDRVKTR